MSNSRSQIWVMVLAVCGLAGEASAVQKLDERMHHLRWGATREWQHFPEKAGGDRLVLKFQSRANDGEQALRLRHRDLRHAWEVAINGRKIATLPRDQPETVTFWAVPPHTLLDGENTVTVVCTAKPPATTPAVALPPAADDIEIGDIALLDVPRDVALSESSIDVTVVDSKTEQGLPCRVTVVDDRGALIDLGNSSDDRTAARPGVVYTADGRTTLRLPAGSYTLYAGRGFEYSLASSQVVIRPGERATQHLRIRRVVATDGWVACDPHVHTFTHSRHGDATVAERMWTLAGEGIELAIATDHNLNIDCDAVARQTGARAYFTPVTGNELTTRVGHFNVFRLRHDGPLPDFRAPTWDRVSETIQKSTEGTPAVVILNHGRDIHNGFRPFDPSRHISLTGENLDGWRLPVNAMEVINSGATLTDPMLLFNDWFGLMNRGLAITPIGSSDSHDVSRYIVGQARTYVRLPDDDVSRIDPKVAIEAVRAGRVMVSYGLLAEVTVQGRHRAGDLVSPQKDATQALDVEVNVSGPDWTSATEVTLYLNGLPIRTEKLAAPKEEHGSFRLQFRHQLRWPSHDVWLTAIARGPGVTKAYWPVSQPYQQTSPRWSPYMMGSSGAIRIDGDGSGQFDSAYDYAVRIVEQAAGDPARCFAALATMEGPEGVVAESIAAQVTGLLRHRLNDGWEAAIEHAKESATPAVRRGVDAFLAEWRAGTSARAAAGRGAAATRLNSP